MTISMLGSAHVNTVGASDGLGVVGAKVGSNVGRDVIGLFVGCIVGSEVGPDVGDVVGLPVGSLGLGDMVGSAMQYTPSSPHGKIPFQLCVTRPLVSTPLAYTRNALTPSTPIGM